MAHANFNHRTSPSHLDTLSTLPLSMHSSFPTSRETGHLRPPLRHRQHHQQRCHMHSIHGSSRKKRREKLPIEKSLRKSLPPMQSETRAQERDRIQNTRLRRHLILILTSPSSCWTHFSGTKYGKHEE